MLYLLGGGSDGEVSLPTAGELSMELLLPASLVVLLPAPLLEFAAAALARSSFIPHWPQKRLVAGFSAPQVGHLWAIANSPPLLF
jgi:hypothetical protein